MSTTTTNYGLVKPVSTDMADLTIFVGQNMDTIDTKLKNVENKANGVVTPVSLSGIRYVRDTTNGNTVNTNNYWVEIQAVDNTSTNVALNKTVTGSSTPIAGTLPVVTDGTIGSASGQYVALTSGSQWVKIDLGALYDITSVSIYRYYSDGRTCHNMLTEVSADGTTWYTIYDSSVSGEYAETASGKTIAVNINSLTPTQSSTLTSAFRATPSATLAVATSAGKVNFATEDYDNLNEYDNITNYRFTAQKTGLYLISASIRTNGTASAPVVQMFLYKNGTNYIQLGHVYGGTTVIVTVSNSVPIKLNAGDYLEIWAQSSVALTTTNGISTTGSWFSAAKIG